ncbi:hypothetical protein CLAIMM_11519 [Cladophialophora immunda]|nr:hypothetical protein CLAIMM_11519 [Cladophialophora immunda]
MSKAILITGATGKQGGSVVNALLRANADYQILALTRDPEAASAKRLLQKSPKIKLVAGNMDAADNIFAKAKEASSLPIWGVFSVQLAIGNGASLNTDPTNVPHFASKYNIEQYLFEKTKNQEMDWTVLRPVAFFENLVPGFLGKVFTASWARNLRKDQKLQLIATSDIGFFAAEAFMKPEQYKNTKLSLAGDELTYDQFKTIFEQRIGTTLPTTFSFIAGLINWMVKDLGYMFRWFRDVGYGADISSLKQLNPGLKDFGTWLETESQFKKA